MGFVASRWLRVCCLTGSFVAAAIPLRTIAGDVTVEERGSLILPADVKDAGGRPVPIVGLSGIAWMGDDRYVAVMDNSQWLVVFRLELSAAGRPVSASNFTMHSVGDRHDYEDIVWLPAPPDAGKSLDADKESAASASAGRVLLCEEDSPGIHAFDCASGRRLASLTVPEVFRSRRPNRGFESLAIDAEGRHVWTANEEPLAVDGPAVSADAAGVVRLARVPIARPDAGRGPAAIQHAYPVDPPHRFVKLLDGPVFSGVTAIACLSADRLLVLERSGCPGLPPFQSRLYEVSLDGAEDVSSVRENLAEKASSRVAKRLVWKGQLGINLEGLCLGPKVASGGRVLVGIADNGGLDTPSRLVVFGLNDGG